MTNESLTKWSVDPRVRTAATAPYLEASAERSLLVRACRGDSAATQELVNSHMRMVVRVAMRFYHSGIPMQDLISEGVVGLLMAVRRFEVEREHRFATYAAWWVRAYVRKYAENNRGIVPLPSTRGVRLVRASAGGARRQLSQRLQREATPEEIAAELGVPESDVTIVERAHAYTDQSLTLDDAGRSLDVPADGHDPETIVSGEQERRARAQRVHATLEQLKPRDRYVVEQHYMSDDPLQMTSIARSIGTSRQRVSQLLARVRGELRAELHTDA